MESAKANSLSLVRFDTNDYSVPTAYAHHHVTAVGNIQEVRLIVNDRVVARHPRDWVRENVHYNPLHYLALWSESRDLWTLLDRWRTGICRSVLACCVAGSKGTDSPQAGEFIRVLRLLETLELAELTCAIERPWRSVRFSVDAIRLLAQQGREQPA